MTNILIIAILIFNFLGVKAQLPGGCTPINNQILSNTNPADSWGEVNDLEENAPPKRIGWDTTMRAIPTQHFATNQATNNMVGIQLFPYVALLTSEGICYDAYTLDRWSDENRQETMDQQTPSEVGAPWNKVRSVGTNMRQMAIGPDGNPKAQFTGRSGVKIGIESSGDPVWTDFGDMFANWQFTNLVDGGTMDVPMVRGSALLTHIFNNANPVIVPYCLSSVNGETVSYQCPVENPILDIGEGFLDGSNCDDGHLHIILRTTKPLEDVTQVQYAAAVSSQWPGDMVNCDAVVCEISEDKLRVDIILDTLTGDVSFAVNVIGRFLIPQDWINEPYTCTILKDSDINRNDQRLACSEEFCHTPACSSDGSDFTLLIELGTAIGGPEAIQFAVGTADSWTDSSNHAPMLTCGSDAEATCEVSEDGLSISLAKPMDSGDIKYAVNVIGRFVQPPGDWQNQPFEHSCSGDPGSTTDTPTVTTDPDVGTTTTDSITTSPGADTTTETPPTIDPSWCTNTPELPPCPNSFCKYTFVDTDQGFLKIVTQYSEPLGGGITDVEIAFNTIDNWDDSHAMMPCTSDVCSVNADNTELTYCTSVLPTGYAYALNIIGRMIQPNDWINNPFWVECGTTGVDLGSGTKFILELDEPGDNLPDQTRKYVLYFSEEMNGLLNADGLRFQPSSGGEFSGTLQMAYTGATPRGDTEGTDYFDNYADGTYSNNALTEYCVEDDIGYVSFNWNKEGDGDMLMIAMPHHEALLEATGATLIDTPFTFKGVVADSWLLEYLLQPATIMPDADAVTAIQENPDELKDILDGLDLDVSGYWIDDSCTEGGSYWAGKDIAMTARAATISRAFGTNYSETFDPSLMNCLEKWLRIDDTLNDGDKLKYDTVWGGIISRGVDDGADFDPGANFGFVTYNDHHFHLGYWVYAMAYYAQFYPEWAESRIEEILFYVRNIANPSMDDQYFPVARHKDFYIGHSWASGIAGGTRTQESSSEAIAAYHGVAALGYSLGNQLMEDFGRLMLAMEIHSVREYYHVREHNVQNFPPYIQQYGAIGMFSEEAILMYTLYWPCGPNVFPARHACLVGIQVLPITSVSGYFMDQEWATSVNTVCQWSVDPESADGAELVDPEQLLPVEFGWGAFCLAASSALDDDVKQQTADYIRGKGPRDFVSGTGSASTYLFIYGRT